MNPDPTTVRVQAHGNRQILVERTFRAAPERVFDAFTRPDLLMRWMSTPDWPMIECASDPTAGGTFRYVWRAGDGSGTMGVSGTFEAVEPLRLEHTEIFDEDWTGGEVHVVTEFTASDAGCLVRMMLTYSTSDARDRVLQSGMARGLDLNYDNLDDLLAGYDVLFTVDPERDLVLERVIGAPPSRVWAAWTEPELLVQWFAPAPWTTAHATVEPHPGGAFQAVMQSPEGETMEGPPGCVLVAVKGRLFVWTDALGPGFAPNPEPFFTAIVRLRPHPTGTRYQVIARHADAEARERHAAMGFSEGWGTAASQLAAIVEASAVSS